MGVTADNVGTMTSEAIQAICLANAPRSSLLRHPVVRRIYLVFFVLSTLLVLIPFWSLLYLQRANRPRNTWTLKRCLRVRWSRRLCALVARCEIDYLGRDLSIDLDPLTLSHSHPITIPAAPMSFLRGHPAITLEQLHKSRGAWNPHFIYRADRTTKTGVWNNWNPSDKVTYGFDAVKAFWYTGQKDASQSQPAAREPGSPVGLHFHGGGYLCGTAAETDLTSSIPKALVIHSPIHHILSVDYRLAPKAPWPLPLLDAISAYRYLVTQGIPERDIVIIGDSAGGHLGMALARWVRDEGSHVGLESPRGLVLLSPWSDLGFTNAWHDVHHNADSDTIDDTFGPFACSLLLRALPASIMHTSEYLSPASLLLPSSESSSFAGFPATYIVSGGAERLSTSIDLLWERLQITRDIGTSPDKRFVSPDAIHDFAIFPWMADEAADMYQDLDGWLRNLLLSDNVDDQVDESISNSAEASLLLIRRQTRDSLRVTKSPVMRPLRDTGARMVEDMTDEGISLIDIPPLELGGGEWLTPFTTQFEPGEYDCDDGERLWYEGSGSSSPSESDMEESRKNK